MSRVRLVMPSPIVDPTIAVPGAAGLSLAGFSPSALVAPVAGITLFEETFEDSNLAARGWYDLAAPVVTSEESHAGLSSLEMHFNLGSLITIGGSLRHLFTPTDRVYVRFWVKYSTNWVGSGQTFHPHEFMMITDEDGDFVGPNSTRLTAYIEHVVIGGGGRPTIGMTDQLNVDQDNVGVDLTEVTEIRAAHGCNGFLEFSHSTTSCFDSGGGVFTHDRNWNDSQVRFTDLIKNNWNKVEAYFQLNTILGGIGQQDGIIRYWFNDVLTIEHVGVVLRTGQFPDMKFNQMLVAPFIGAGSPVDQTIWYDDILVATARPGVPTSPVVMPGSASITIVSFPPAPITTGPQLVAPGSAALVVTGFAPTISLGTASPEIQRALFTAPNVWDIQGVAPAVNAVGFQNGGSSTPGVPHSAALGVYSINIPVVAWSVPNLYNFADLISVGIIEMDFEIQADVSPTTQIRAMKFQTSTAVVTSGVQLGGLQFGVDSSPSVMSAVFEGFGSSALIVSFEVAWDSAPLSSSIQINNLADGAFHNIRFWYDVASLNRRMRLEVDGQALTRPNGTPAYILNAAEDCGGQFGIDAATWQDGWIERCAVDGGIQIGSGSWIPSGTP